MNFFCRIGIHRDLAHEERHYVRDVTDAGETVNAWENKVCRCGAVIATKSHSVHESTITTTEELENASQPDSNRTATADS